MTSYTVTVTDREQEVLEWLVRTLNTEKGTTLDVQAYLQQRVPELIQPYDLRYHEALSGEVKQRFTNADSAVQQQVRQLLGLP